MSGANRDTKFPTLFATSFLSLFLELLIIRWLSSDFVLFGVFKTFPLVACYVGLGTGVARGDQSILRLAPAALLITIIVTSLTSYAGYGYLPFPSLSIYQWNELSSSYALSIEVVKMTLLLILLLMGPFAVMFCLGNVIGHCFSKLPPLKAYCIDIAGAISGSLTFALMSFLGASPHVELLITIAVLFTIIWGVSDWHKSIFLYLPLSAVATLIPIFNEHNTFWSPYYRLDLQEISLAPQFTKSGKKEDLGIYLNTNRGFSQSYTNNNRIELSESGEKIEQARYLKNFLLVREEYYALPYKFASPKEILILGAGTGSDVAQSVKQGVGQIDAVEIDQTIINLAKKYNKYANHPSVHYYLDDGRRFLARTNKKYDMVILACLDSRAFSGSGSSLRTDCYVHTKESYKDCVEHLKPNGIMVLSFGASVGGASNWLRDRIYQTLLQVTGYPPAVFSDEKSDFNWPAYFFITGEPIRQSNLKEPEKSQSQDSSFAPESTQNQISPAAKMQKIGFSEINMKAESIQDNIVLSDDWPFLYIKDKSLDLPYLFVLALFSAITIYVGRGLIFGAKNHVDIQLFYLGAAFILLELQAISRLSLIYGATWITSSVVINGVLVMILLANWFALRNINLGMRKQYLLLFLSILISFLAPSFASKGLGSLHSLEITIATLLPVFVAGLIFASSFKGSANPSRSFAFNLLGSVLGGLLEYLSGYIGISNLLLVSGVLYLLSYISWNNGVSKTKATS